jgi:predicted ATPase
MILLRYGIYVEELNTLRYGTETKDHKQNSLSTVRFLKQLHLLSSARTNLLILDEGMLYTYPSVHLLRDLDGWIGSAVKDGWVGSGISQSSLF